MAELSGIKSVSKPAKWPKILWGRSVTSGKDGWSRDMEKNTERRKVLKHQYGLCKTEDSKNETRMRQLNDGLTYNMIRA